MCLPNCGGDVFIPYNVEVAAPAGRLSSCDDTTDAVDSDSDYNDFTEHECMSDTSATMSNVVATPVRTSKTQEWHHFNDYYIDATTSKHGTQKNSRGDVQKSNVEAACYSYCHNKMPMRRGQGRLGCGCHRRRAQHAFGVLLIATSASCVVLSC